MCIWFGTRCQEFWNVAPVDKRSITLEYFQQHRKLYGTAPAQIRSSPNL